MVERTQKMLNHACAVCQIATVCYDCAYLNVTIKAACSRVCLITSVKTHSMYDAIKQHGCWAAES